MNKYAISFLYALGVILIASNSVVPGMVCGAGLIVYACAAWGSY